MRISLNSCSLSSCAAPWGSLIDRSARSPGYFRRKFTALSDRSGWNWAMIVFFGGVGGLLRLGAELRQGFIQLIGELHQLADGCDGSAGTLRSLPRNVGNDLHGVRNAFRTAHLLLGSERDFLDEFGGLTDNAGNRIECAACLIG